MICIEMSQKSGVYTLETQGHAEYAEPGKDIVCAAVSILVFTLIESIDERDLREPSVIEQESGKVLVRVKPKQSTEGKIRSVFEVIKNGFLLLEKNYKKNIKFSCVGVRE